MGKTLFSILFTVLATNVKKTIILNYNELEERSIA